jgi:hypothetical protein
MYIIKIFTKLLFKALNNSYWQQFGKTRLKMRILNKFIYSISTKFSGKSDSEVIIQESFL